MAPRTTESIVGNLSGEAVSKGTVLRAGTTTQANASGPLAEIVADSETYQGRGNFLFALDGERLKETPPRKCAIFDWIYCSKL